MLLGFDRFGSIPGHGAALDVGAITRDGRALMSLANAGEFYLLTSYAPGHLYADELRRIAQSATLEERDVATPSCSRGSWSRCTPSDDPKHARARFVIWSAAERACSNHRVCADVPAAPPERLRRIEALAVDWRWRLAPQVARLRARTATIILQRGVRRRSLRCSTPAAAAGDPADDVTCMAINYVFSRSSTRARGRTLGLLWRRFGRCTWTSRDSAPARRVRAFLAWRGLVVANPVWYPAVRARGRDRMLGLIERTLAAERFDPGFAEDLFK
jgi:hypothetical protein